MINLRDIRKGMQIFGADNQSFGTVEDVQDQYIIVNGQRYEANAFTMEGNRLMLAGKVTTLTPIPKPQVKSACR